MDIDETTRRAIVRLLESAPDMFAAPAPGWETEAAEVVALLGSSDESWSASADQDAPCARPDCSHPYARHFDSYEDMAPVGCKYCACPAFVPAEAAAAVAF